MAASSSKLDKEWFVERMRRRGLSMRSLAKEIGLDPAALSKTLNGTRKMQVDEVVSIASVLGEQEADVLVRATGGDPSQSGAPTRVDTGRHPLFGCLKGMLVIPPDLDLTQPADPELADYLDRKYGEDWSLDR